MLGWLQVLDLVGHWSSNALFPLCSVFHVGQEGGKRCAINGRWGLSGKRLLSLGAPSAAERSVYSTLIGWLFLVNGTRLWM